MLYSARIKIDKKQKYCKYRVLFNCQVNVSQARSSGAELTFAERARMKLEQASKLVKPNLQFQESSVSIVTTEMTPEETTIEMKGRGKYSDSTTLRPLRSDEEKSGDEKRTSKYQRNRVYKDSPSRFLKSRQESLNNASKTKATVEEITPSKLKSKKTVGTLRNFGEQHSTTKRSIQNYTSSEKKFERSHSFSRETLKKPTAKASSIRRSFNKDDSTTENSVDSTTNPAPRYTNRYSRKKAQVTHANPVKEYYRKLSTEAPIKRRDFRPRTATYRRHSESTRTSPVTTTTTTGEPTVKIETARSNLAQTTTTPVPPTTSFSISTENFISNEPTGTSFEASSVAITPKAPKYHATIKPGSGGSTPRSSRQEPAVNLKISNDSNSASGIMDSSNGNSGNSNIFNPTRSVFLSESNSTILEQLRSTVAPLLSSLGTRSPVFAGVYQNSSGEVGNNQTITLVALLFFFYSLYFYFQNAPRITPSGAPPKFSAKYRGAELFVRRPVLYHPTVTSVVSSTSPSSITEVDYKLLKTH